MYIQMIFVSNELLSKRVH